MASKFFFTPSMNETKRRRHWLFQHDSKHSQEQPYIVEKLYNQNLMKNIETESPLY